VKHWKIIFWVIIGIIILVALTAAFVRTGSVRAGHVTNIDPTDHWAWDDVNGWWDFYTTDTVVVTNKKLAGYASSNIGEMALDCSTTSLGNICATSNFGICNGPGPHSGGTCPNGDANGVLTGYAWNDVIGWISFNCDQSTHPPGANDCASSSYNVSIDGNGDFQGFAWNDVVGWINFNSGTYKVKTAWTSGAAEAFLESSVIDTENPNGVILQSIIWQGSYPAGTTVKFQVAGSTSEFGPWTFVGPAGSTTDYYGSKCPQVGTGNIGPNQPICINEDLFSTTGMFPASRYLRYKMRLQSNAAQDQTPRVDDVILNWAR
jgi:hypothetical protein